MSREIRIYNTAFNRDELPHIMHSSLSSYLTFLENYRMRTYTSESYRITDNRLLLSVMPTANATINKAQARRVVYAAEVETENGAITSASFYHVRNGIEKSGFYEFSLSRDLWAEHIHNAEFSQFHITRCNRDIDSGKGIYDDVKIANERVRYAREANATINGYCVVFLASVVVSTGWFGTEPLTANFMFKLGLDEIASLVISTYANADILDKIRFVIGGIKSTGEAFDPAGNKCQVTRCWILPKDVVTTSGLSISKLVTKSVMTGANDCEIFNVPVVTNTITNSLLYMQDIVNYNEHWSDLYPSNELGFGVNGHTAPITRFTGANDAYVRYLITSDDVRVLFDQGGKIEDLSAQFELNLGINNQAGNAMAEIAKTSGKILSLLVNTAAGYAKGGAAGAAVGAASSFLPMIAGTQGGGLASGQGDAATTYGAHSATHVRKPFVVSYVPSISDEEEHAYFMGAKFDVYRNDFAAIQASTHLGDVAADKQRDGTFITSDGFDVEYLPVEVEDYVRAEFGRGIWLYVI